MEQIQLSINGIPNIMPNRRGIGMLLRIGSSGASNLSIGFLNNLIAMGIPMTMIGVRKSIPRMPSYLKTPMKVYKNHRDPQAKDGARASIGMTFTLARARCNMGLSASGVSTTCSTVESEAPGLGIDDDESSARS